MADTYTVLIVIGILAELVSIYQEYRQ